MKCPRRIEGPFLLPDEDCWRDDGTCSYCGSLDPDMLMARLEVGDVEVGPTDKSYKIYVKNEGGHAFKMSFRSCPKDATCQAPTDCTHWVTEDRVTTKFYFQHLSDAQKNRFIELYNDKKMKIGYPGHFYVRPFFCRSN